MVGSIQPLYERFEELGMVIERWLYCSEAEDPVACFARATQRACNDVDQQRKSVAYDVDQLVADRECDRLHDVISRWPSRPVVCSPDEVS